MRGKKVMHTFRLGAVGVLAAALAIGAAVPAQAEDDYFTIVVMPDSQFAAAKYPDILNAQTQWIHDNVDALNIEVVLQEGDVVNSMATPAEWTNASQAYQRIDNVPLVIAAGNHDLQDYTSAAMKSKTDALTPQVAENLEASLVEEPTLLAGKVFESKPGNFNSFIGTLPTYQVDGQFQEGSYANTYTLIDALDGKYLVLSIEFGAPNDVLAWAKQVAAEHADRYVILLTHDYLNQKSQVRGAPGNGSESSLPKSFNPALNNPYTIWTKLVKASPNIKFVFSGHVNTKTPEKPYAVGSLKSKNAAGKYVYQMLANYQMYRNGGDGFLRIIKVYPSGKKVVVTSYSPWLDKYLTGGKDRFTYSDVNLRPLG